MKESYTRSLQISFSKEDRLVLLKFFNLFCYFCVVFFLLPQRTYIFTFLLSSRVFIHPHELLAKVGQICIKQKQQLETGTEAEKVNAPLCPSVSWAAVTYFPLSPSHCKAK